MSPDQLQVTYQQINPFLPVLAGVLALAIMVPFIWALARAARSLTLDRCIVPAVALAVTALGAGALYTSFVKVSELAQSWLPGSIIDGAIGVFTVIALAKARKGERVVWVDVLQWALIAVTVVANAWGEKNLALVLLHGCQPIVWKASVAGLKALILDRAGVAIAERIPPLRWVQAPVGTFHIWRWLTLGRVGSYAEALELDHEVAALAIVGRYEAGEATARDEVLYRRLAGRSLVAPPEAAAPPVDSGLPTPQPVARRRPPARTGRARHPRAARAAAVDLELVARMRETAAQRGHAPVDLSQRAWLEVLKAQPEGGVHISKVAAALRHIEEEARDPITAT